MLRQRFARPIALCILCATTAAAAAQRPDPPLTMGRLALMAGTPDAALVAALRRALDDADPGLRFIAARLAGTLKVVSLEDALRSRIAPETNDWVAAEIIRALLVIDTPSAREAVESGLGTTPMRIQSYALWLARPAPDRLIAAVPKLTTALGPSADLSRPLRLAGAQHPALREQLLRTALDSGAAGTWKGMVLSAPSGESPVMVDLLRDALRSPNAAIREHTVWQVVGWVERKADLAPTLVSEAVTIAADQPMSWERFGRELVARHGSKTSPVDRSAWLKEQAALPTARSEFTRSWPAPLLTAQELAVAREVRGSSWPQPLSPEQQKAIDTLPSRVPDALPQSPLRTVPAPWQGFLASVLDASGCRTSASQQYGAISVGYRPDGRIASAAADQAGLADACLPALGAIARVTLADDTRPVDSSARQWLVLSTNDAIVACADIPSVPASAVRSGESSGALGQITEPRRIRDVRPMYPPSQVQARAQGSVIVHTVITTSGCVKNAQVMRSVNPALDLAAVIAVLQWRFSPLLVDGKPFETDLTTTVNFTLN